MADYTRASLRRLILCLLFLLCSLLQLHALDIYLAPVSIRNLTEDRVEKIDSGDFTGDLLKSIKITDHEGIAQIQSLSQGADSPEGYLEAARLCADRGITYLLFGFFTRTEIGWDCELRMYNHETRKIEILFLARDTADHYDRLVQELTRKILDYLYTDLGMSAYDPMPAPEKNIFVLPLYLNYWTPAGGDWGETSTGIARLESGLLLTPVQPLFMRGDVPWEFQTGLTLAYSLAVNDADYESFILHSFRLNLPLTMSAGLAENQFIDLGGGLSMQFDLLFQDRLYYGAYSTFNTAAGCFLQLGYRYGLTDSWTIGVRSALEFAFYSPVQAALVLGLSGHYRIGQLKQ